MEFPKYPRNINVMGDARNKINFDQFSHDYVPGINRRMMEREAMFNHDTKITPVDMNSMRNPTIPNHNPTSRLNSGLGEITGQQFDPEQMSQGMPMRSYIRDDSKTRYTDAHNSEPIYNPQLDFDLFESKPNLNVNYFDPSNAPNSNNFFSGLNENTQLLPDNTNISAESRMSAVSNKFTFSFLHKFCQNLSQLKSIIISPFSMIQLFAILYRGSKGITENELRDFFNFYDKNETLDSLIKLNKSFPQTLKRMNMIIIPNHIMLNQAFASHVIKLGNIIQIDASVPLTESQRLDSIIHSSTNGMINNIITPDMLNRGRDMLLVNTLYFYCKWKKTFNPKYTKQEPFFGLQRYPVHMMLEKDGTHRYYEDNQYQVIEKDYADDVFAFGIVLPKDKYDKPLVDDEYFQYVISQLKPQKINMFKMPKFRHQSKVKIDNLFKKYGLRNIFERPDFSEILPSTNTYVSDIIHVAVIDVNETGIETTAMTTYNSTSSHSINFIANHPFLYYIRFRPTNTIIFTGLFF